MSYLNVKKIECDTLIHRSGMEPISVHVSNARVTILWHIKRVMYLAEIEVGMTADELALYQELTAMITERVAKELER